jgi:hypothetical protein
MNRVTMLFPLLALFLSVGCYNDSDSFIEASAKFSCVRLDECDRSAFEDRYNGDMAACRIDYEDKLEDVYDFIGGVCEYVPEEGKKCISTQRAYKRDCSSTADNAINNDCDKVVDCF